MIQFICMQVIQAASVALLFVLGWKIVRAA